MGATVHFKSNEIAFDLKYATAGNVVRVGESDEIKMPEEYDGQTIGKTSTTETWEIGRLDFDGSGNPIYIEIVVGLHPQETVSRSILVSFDENSPIITSAKGNSINVRFLEVVQTYRDTTTGISDQYINALFNEDEDFYNNGRFDCEKYLNMFDVKPEWKDLSKNMPQGLKGTNGLTNQAGSNGQYTLLLEITPADTGLNFSNINIDFDLKFEGGESSVTPTE